MMQENSVTLSGPIKILSKGIWNVENINLKGIFVYSLEGQLYFSQAINP